MFRIPAELKNVKLGNPDVLQQLPSGVFGTLGLDAAEFRKQAFQSAVKIDVCLAAREKFHQVPTKSISFFHRVLFAILQVCGFSRCICPAASESIYSNQFDALTMDHGAAKLQAS